jgi:hypothetical protein
VRFWDSSAIVPLLVAEPTSQDMLDRLRDDDRMIVWWGTPVECVAALARREREGLLDPGAVTLALGRLRDLEPTWIEVGATREVRRVAQRLLRTHPLRAGDSVQLAAAIVAAERETDSLAFVSLDQRLNDAARREGFAMAP